MGSRIVTSQNLTPILMRPAVIDSSALDDPTLRIYRSRCRRKLPAIFSEVKSRYSLFTLGDLVYENILISMSARMTADCLQ